MPRTHAEAVALSGDGYMTNKEYLEFCEKNGFDPNGPLHQEPNQGKEKPNSVKQKPS